VNHHTKVVVSVGLGFALVVMLVGCSPKAHVSARLQGGEVRFVLCESFPTTKLDVAVSPLADETTNYQVVWAARGLGKTDHVAVVYGAPPEGFVSTDGPRKLIPRRPGSTWAITTFRQVVN
jgi:hypothetical protein